MLDKWLEVVAEHEQKNQAQTKLANALSGLPDDVLRDIASGKEKLGSECGDVPLAKYKGTPLFQEALELEKAELAARMLEVEHNRNKPRLWEELDEIRVKRKMLELQLAEIEASAEEGAPEDDSFEETPVEIEEAKTASDTCWLDRFKGTPLFDKALELEKTELAIRTQEQQHRAEQDAQREEQPDFYKQRSGLDLQRKALDLELAALGESSAAAESPTTVDVKTAAEKIKQALFIMPGDVGALGGAMYAPEGEKLTGALRGAGYEIGGSLIGAAVGTLLGGMAGPAGAATGAGLGYFGGGLVGANKALEKYTENDKTKKVKTASVEERFARAVNALRASNT